MTLNSMNMRGVLVASLVIAPACGEGKGAGEATDPGTTGSTTDAPTGGPTDGTGGEATDATTGGTSGATDATTDATTGEAPDLRELCLLSFANGQAIVEEQCGCAVDLGEYPDVAACLAEVDGGTATDACKCDVYDHYPETEAGLECATPVQATLLACVDGVDCVMELDAFSECLDAYFMAIQMCAGPPKAALAEVALVCEGMPPFMCGSGESIPEGWVCNLEVDCMDGSDEMNCPTFMCRDGTEIPLSYKCDGFPDCADQSDEADCP